MTQRLPHPPAIDYRQALLRGLGGLLLLAALALLAWTEHGELGYRQAIAHQGGEVLDLGSQPPASPPKSGTLVRVSGTPTVVRPPLDAQFNQRAEVPMLIRHVEMFQWREVRIGDQLHYEMDWVDRPLASADFSQPVAHRNPGAFPVQGKQFEAAAVRLGGFNLSAELVHQLPGSVLLAPRMDSLPANLAASFSLDGNYLVTSAQPAQPRLGDLRISWEVVPRQALTVLAKVAGDSLVPLARDDEAHGFAIQVGERSLADLLPGQPSPPASVALRRIVAIVLGLLGGFLLLRRSARVAGRQGAAAGVMAVALVGMAIWLGADGMVALAWLALALLALIVLLWRWRDRH